MVAFECVGIVLPRIFLVNRRKKKYRKKIPIFLSLCDFVSLFVPLHALDGHTHDGWDLWAKVEEEEKFVVIFK